MKKYFFGLSAIVLAIAFSAFTKPTKSLTNAIFEYTDGTFTQTSVQTLSSWTQQSLLSCDESGTTKACQIEVSDLRYHDNGEELVLNDQAFIDDVAAHPENHAGDLSDVKMTIVAAIGDNTVDYLVSSSGTTAVDIDNKTIN